MGERLERLIEHLAWADREVIRCLKRHSALPPNAVPLMAHVLAAEKVWLCRATGQGELAPPVWPRLSLDECDVMGVQNADALRQLAFPYDPERMGRIVSYRNTRGDQFENALEDILLHVCMHGSYHRGQIAAVVRASGGEPINTDYITFVRMQGG